MSNDQWGFHRYILTIQSFVINSRVLTGDNRRPPIMAFTQPQLGRLEINIALRRFIRKADGSVRSYNPAPPKLSGGRSWPVAEAVLNKRFRWADPRTASRRTKIAGPDWLERQHRAAFRAGREITRDQARPYLLDRTENLARLLDSAGGRRGPPWVT